MYLSLSSSRGNVIVTTSENGFNTGAQSLREGTSVGTDIKMLNQFDKVYSDIGLFGLRKDNPKKALRKIAERIFRQNSYASQDDFIKILRQYEVSMIDAVVNSLPVPGVNTELH